MKYHNIPEVQEGEHTKVHIEEVEKYKMLIKLLKKYSPYKISKDKLVDYHKATIYRKYQKIQNNRSFREYIWSRKKKENEPVNWRIHYSLHCHI